MAALAAALVLAGGPVVSSSADTLEQQVQRREDAMKTFGRNARMIGNFLQKNEGTIGDVQASARTMDQVAQNLLALFPEDGAFRARGPGSCHRERPHRSLYDRSGLRYPSDLTDAEWEIIAPLIPPAKRGGRRRKVDVRAVVNGLLYMLENSCKGRCLPKGFPPRSTVHSDLQLWAWDGTLERIHHALYV